MSHKQGPGCTAILLLIIALGIALAFAADPGGHPMPSAPVEWSESGR